MELSERKLKIMQAIVSDFIATAEPVGSRSLSRKFELGISPATIRNEMADLEEMGYLTHPHTSAGRVPSDKAYRLYVNSLMDEYEIPDEQKRKIRIALKENLTELEKTIKHASEVLSELTNLTSFATVGKDLDDAHLFLEGMSRIFAHPEFNNFERTRHFLEMVDRQDDLKENLTKRAEGITITIGDENESEIMPDSSIITATYHVGGRYVGKLGVIGPTRMRYEEVTSVIDYMTQNIERAFKLLEGDSVIEVEEAGAAGKVEKK